MAYKLTYWKVEDENTASELKSTRLISVNEVQPLSLPHNRPAGTDAILLERTDGKIGKRPNVGQCTKIIWANDKARNCSAI